LVPSRKAVPPNPIRQNGGCGCNHSKGRGIMAKGSNGDARVHARRGEGI